MANTVNLDDYEPHVGLLSKTQVKDLVDVLFRGDRTFHIHTQMHESRRSRPTLGLHMYSPFFDQHDIYLAPRKIRECFEAGRSAAGNRAAPDLRIAMGMVLAHELQHANQSIVHSTHPDSFYGKKRSRYRMRPCEREARQFADDSIPIIAGVLGIELKKEYLIEVPSDELNEVAECLAEADEITVPDIVEELRQSGLNNIVNIQKVRALLEGWDVRVA
jgi:hypothetical protein